MKKRGILIIFILIVIMNIKVLAIETYQVQSSGDSYEIKDLIFKDANNAESQEIVPFGKISNVIIEKKLPDASATTILVVVYDSAKRVTNLKQIVADENMLVNTPTQYEVNLSFGENINGLSIKVFVWDGVSNIRPLAGVFTSGKDKTKISLQVSQNKELLVSLSADGIETFDNKAFTITYDPSKLEMIDAFANTPNFDTSVGVVNEITILENSEGLLRFSKNVDVENNNLWSGLVNRIRFIGKTTAETIITVELQ